MRQGQSYEGHGPDNNNPYDWFFPDDRDAGFGRPVLASAAGTVAWVNTGIVSIDHGGGWSTLYGHMDTTAVTRGQSVDLGARIGTVGDTATGEGVYHVHYVQALDGVAQPVVINGKKVNYYPIDYKSTPYISWNSCPGGVLPANEPPPTCEPGSAPTADYRFRDTLSSIASGAPDLQPLGSTTFATETVEGRSRKVMTFADGNGLELNPIHDVIGSRIYTLVVLFRLNSTQGLYKLIDLRGGTTDRGIYVRAQKVEVDNHQLWSDSLASPTTVAANRYVQLVVSHDGYSDRTDVYLDGVRQTGWDFWNDLATIGPRNSIRLFRDDDITISDPQTYFRANPTGAVARLRLYGRALSASEVTALDKLPAGETQPAPGPVCTAPQPTQTTPPPSPDVTTSPSPSPSPSGTPPVVKDPSQTLASVQVTNTRLVVRGAVEPTHTDGDVKVILSRKSSGQFRKVSAKTVSLDSQGLFKAAFGRPKAGSCRIVAKFLGDDDHLASTAKIQGSC